MLKGGTNEKIGGYVVGKVTNVRYWSRNIVKDILIFYNLEAEKNLFPFPLVTA